MQQILVYGDSLSWGIVPLTRQRLPFRMRWPGVLEARLNARATADEPRVRVLEDCINGRRTVFEDPFKPGRNGLDGLWQRIEAQSPLALVVLMLGTNDFQSMHPHVAWHAAQGVGRLIDTVRSAPIEPGMPVPPILVVAPPPIQAPKGPIEPKFVGADVKCRGLAQAYRAVAAERSAAFFDAGASIHVSPLDGVHLDRDQHASLGAALAPVVQELLDSAGTSAAASLPV
jgi:lysophospholipase L1-like esterase